MLDDCILYLKWEVPALEKYREKSKKNKKSRIKLVVNKTETQFTTYNCLLTLKIFQFNILHSIYRKIKKGFHHKNLQLRFLV